MVAAVPVVTLRFSPRQLIGGPINPQNVGPPSSIPQILPPSLSSTLTEGIPLPSVHEATILGLPTAITTVTELSTSTSIVPSSTTTRILTSTPPPSIVATASSTVIEQTTQTILAPDVTVAPPIETTTTAVNVSAKSNGAVDLAIRRGGTDIRWDWTFVLGLFCAINLV
ncbi:hypothetical protein P691DRAFT_757708 [Macrolepiota fuliginosa MF-IS2]|uniref:Uncharacterized protein n=1 Tax=Macrolepiota fuliginosa MF-IS2 TaxID=1400762 RepID=A0A9P5XHH8_9AGAR|nr:hypothetical protein P691DRAFT_757708 [Macrolepiota fuliginosa MF-IS2]